MTTHPIDRLFATIAARKGADPSASYTAKLLSEGRAKCAKKLGEEAIETCMAAVGEDRAALTAESADLVYHLLVLLRRVRSHAGRRVSGTGRPRRPFGPRREGRAQKR